MSPADHYAEAERLIGMYTDALPQSAEDGGHVLWLAQLHATLATVEPDVLRRAGLGPVAQHPACTCGRAKHDPAMILSQDLACPIHGIQTP